MAGLISGHHIEPRLIPIGAAGLIIFFALLAAVPPSVPNMAARWYGVALEQCFVLHSRCGFLCGFLHHSAAGAAAKTFTRRRTRTVPGHRQCGLVHVPDRRRMLYWASVQPLATEPQNIFYVSSVLMAVGAAFFLWKLRGTGILIGSTLPRDNRLSQPAPAIEADQDPSRAV